MKDQRIDSFFHKPARPVHELSPIVLAYIGDAVYEMFIRQRVVARLKSRPNQLHQVSTTYVSAKAQAKSLAALRLSEHEQDIVKRGRNAKSGTAPKNTDVGIYRLSTGLECLLGYLYYTQQHDRLREIMEEAAKAVESESGG